MNYQANPDAGLEDINDVAGTQESVDTEKQESNQPYIVLPFISSISPAFESSPISSDQAYIDELARLQRQEKETNDVLDAANMLRGAFE